METAEEMVPSDESTGGGAVFGEGGILNNSCLCSLLGTHGGGATGRKTNGVLGVFRVGRPEFIDKDEYFSDFSDKSGNIYAQLLSKIKFPAKNIQDWALLIGPVWLDL